MEKVLVTGATGFLGAALLQHLRSEGRAVVGIGRDPARIEQLRRQGFEMRSVDLTRPIAAPEFKGVDAMIHCAALSAPFGPYAAFRAANVTATGHVLELGRALGVQRFVQISSASVSFAPEDRLSVREDMALPRPFNAYARSKAEAETLVLAAPELGPVVLRPRGIYGAGDTALVPRLIRAMERGPLPLLRDGRARIDLTHVDDVARAVSAALVAGQAVTGHVFNISGGEVLPITEIVAAVCQRVGLQARWQRMPLAPLMIAAGVMEALTARLPGAREPAVTRYGLALFAFAQSLDLAKAHRGLGWRPQVTFADGLSRSFPQGAA